MPLEICDKDHRGSFTISGSPADFAGDVDLAGRIAGLIDAVLDAVVADGQESGTIDLHIVVEATWMQDGPPEPGAGDSARPSGIQACLDPC